MAARLAVDRADVDARRAADAAQRRRARPGRRAPACGRRRAGRGGTRAARRPRARPSRATCTGSCARPVDERGSSWRKTSRSRKRGIDLLDPHHRDQHLGQRRAHAAVALGLDDADRARCRRRRSSRPRSRPAPAGTPRAGGAAPPPRARPGSSRELRRARGARGTGRGSRRGSCGSPARGDATAARPRAGRSARPGRSRAAGCPAASSASLSPISSVASDFTLTTSSAPSARTSADHDLVRLRGVARPVHRAAGRLDGRLELDEHGVEAGERLVLDRRAGRRAAPPSRAPRRRPPPACARIVVVACRRLRPQLRVRERRRRGLREALGPRVARGRRCASRREDLRQVHGAHGRARAGAARRRCASGTSCRRRRRRRRPWRRSPPASRRASPPRCRRS